MPLTEPRNGAHKRRAQQAVGKPRNALPPTQNTLQQLQMPPSQSNSSKKFRAMGISQCCYKGFLCVQVKLTGAQLDSGMLKRNQGAATCHLQETSTSLSQRILIKAVRKSLSQVALIPSQVGRKTFWLVKKGSTSSSDLGSRTGCIRAALKARSYGRGLQSAAPV